MMLRMGLVWVALLSPAVLSAQQVNLEELERQLKAKEAEQAEHERRAADAWRRQQEAATEAERLRAVNGDFEEAGNGLLRDTQTGLLWT